MTTLGIKRKAYYMNASDREKADTVNTPLKPLISVIVPIYNVEKYVRKCLESLVNQTMKQIEVICIDDGSTDSSGAIADEYCNTDAERNGKEWPVIRVIHTENRGLSAARTRGIDEARSEWLMFVDSDDWVDERFCEIPYVAAVENKADMVIFQADMVKRGKIRKGKPYSGPVGIVDEMSAHEYGGWAAWNKLYRKGLFDGIQYPVGMAFEDYATTHKLVHKAQRIVMKRECLYHYIYRNGSLTHSHKGSHRREGFAITLERSNELGSYGFSEEKMVSSLLSSAIGFLVEMPPCDDKLYQKALGIVSSIDEIPQTLSLKRKIALKTLKKRQRLFVLLCTVSGRKK